MSEKRFDFGVDIPTKITKYTKRFTWDGDILFDNLELKELGNCLEARDIADLLNELYEENKKLKDIDEELIDEEMTNMECLMEKEYVNIKEENEQLRKKVKDWKFVNDFQEKEIDGLKEALKEKEYVEDENEQLKEENEQLRDELTFLNKVIGFFADNPMTKYSSKSELLEEMKLFEKMGLI